MTKKKELELIENQYLSLSDQLAVARTNLANERTFLAYFRTGIVLFSSGVAMVRLDILEKIYDLGLVLICISPVIIFIGLFRFKNFKSKIKNMCSKLIIFLVSSTFL